VSTKQTARTKRLSESVTMPRKEAERLYPILLARDADPHSGDEQLLLKVLGALGMTTADYAADVAAVAEAERLEAILAGEDDLQARRAEVMGEYERVEREVKEETARLNARLLEARQKVSQLAVDAIPIDRARDELANLHAKHRRAFGLSAPDEPRTPGITIKGHWPTDADQQEADERREQQRQQKRRVWIEQKPATPAV